MIYDTTKPFELEKFKYRAKQLIKQGKKVELKAVTQKRSTDQNSYIHVLFNLYAIEYGYTLKEAKELIKRNCTLLIYEKNGQEFVKGTSELDVEQMTQFIEWLRNWSAQNGCYLPSPDEYRQESNYFDNEINRSKQYL